jgi:hypothetical protein
MAQIAERRSYIEREPCLIHAIPFGSGKCTMCGWNPDDPDKYPGISTPADMVEIACHYCPESVMRSQKFLEKLAAEGKKPACNFCALEFKVFERILQQ